MKVRGRKTGKAWKVFGASSKKYRKCTLSPGFSEKVGEAGICKSLMAPSSNEYSTRKKYDASSFCKGKYQESSKQII